MKKTTSLKTPVLFFLCLLFFSLNVLAQTTYTFSNLGPSNGDFKSISTLPTNINIQISDNFEFVPFVLYPTASGTGSTTFTIKGDGINLGSFDVEDMTWGLFSSEYTLDNTTKVVFHKTDGTTVTWNSLSSLFQQRYSYDTNDHSILSIFSAAGRVSEVEKIEITVDFKDGGDINKFEIRNISLSNLQVPSLATVAIVTTSSISSVTATGTTISGNVTDDGGDAVTERGFVYGTSSNPTTSDTKVQSGIGTGSFSEDISGLKPETTYYVRAYAINGQGTSYGDEESFTTKSEGVLLSSNPTLIFTENSADITGDNIASDGEGSSQTISDIDIQIFNISDELGTFVNSLTWKDNDFLYSADPNYSGLTYDNNNEAIKGMAINSADGSEFRLVKFTYYNWGETNSFTNTIKGYRNGSEVASMTFDGFDSNYNPITVALDASFSSVDDVRIYISDAGWTGNGTTNHSINKIALDAPVSNSAPADIALSTNTLNQSEEENATVGTLSTTDADGGDTHTYSLVLGTGDTDNANFNINGSDLRANDASTLAAGNYSVRIQTSDGTDTYAEAFTITVLDDVAPVFTNSTPSVSGTTVSQTTLTVQLDEIGTAYYIVVAEGDSAPSSAQVKAGQNNSGSSALTNGSINVNAASEHFSVDITGLSSSTDYDIYVTAEDDEETPNLQGSPEKIDVTTNNTVPTFTDLADTVETTNEDTSVEVSFLSIAAQSDANDADGTVIAYVVKSVNSGSLTINGTAYAAGTNDQITPAQNANWTPNANANGTLNAFTITAKDNAGAQSSPAVQAKVAVTAVNDDPTITGLPSSVTITEDATEDAFDISAATISDIDAEGEKLTLTLEATGGVFDIAAGTGITSTGHLSNLLSLTGKLTDLNNYISTSTNIYFRPNTNLSGNAAASVEVSINDNGNTGSGLGTDVYSGSVSVNIIGVNDAPVAVDDNYDLDENTPQTGNVLTNDSDPEGDALTASLVTPPENGTVVLNANGSFTYTPNTNYSGLDNLIYRVCDNGTPSLCNTATVNFEIEEVAASVSSVLVPANATYTTGQNLDFTVNFDKPIVVDTGGGTPSLSLEVGGSTKNASYISGSGSSALVFRYTIQNGDEDPNGIQVSSLSLNGGTFTSGSGTAANLTLNGIGSTAAVLVDALAPTGYTVSIDQNPINSISANAVSFTFAGGEVNTNYNYTFSSAGGGTNVTGSGTLTSATHQISGIDLSALADGSITLSVSLTDAIGNAGSVVTDITSKDTSVPTGYTVELNLLGESMINSVNVEEVKFSASGLETGSTLYYSFASDGGGSTVSGTETITSATENFDNSGVGYDLSGLADGTITLSVYLMDIAGNEGANATTSEIKDTTAPTGYVVTWDDAFINAFESSNTSFTISNAEISTTANYSISSSGDSNMATISNSQLINSTAQQIPLDVSGLADGILTIEITLTDEGDNEGTLVSTNNTILDQTPPASPSIPDLSAASDTGASNTDNNTADQTPTFTGTAEANTSVEIFSEGSSLGTTTTDGSGNWSFTSPILTDGTYAITATATDAAGNVSANSSGLPIIIDQNECNAQANFSLNPNAGCETPLTVFFTDQSTLPDSWYWEFGDGNTSTAQNPIHSYTTYGVFTVKLTVTDTISGCSSSTEKVITNYKLSSDFTSNTTFGCGPLTVDFADSSVGAESWNWDFGDGTTSTEQNPSHTYTQPGTYTVALTTEGGSCSKTNTKTSYIQVIGPDVDFSSDITEGCGPLTVAFTNNTIAGSPAIGWLWDFGDGSTSTQQNPAHEYTAEGIYTVSLTVSDLDGCSRTLTKTDLIEVNMLEAELISTNVTCTGGSDGTITANSDVGLAPFTYEWSNGAATAEISGLSPGNYSVEITDANGCSVKKSVEITEPLPADLVTSNPSAVSYSSAELGGELLNAFDCEQETGIVYATTSNPDITDIKLEMIQTGHQFNENVTGLQLNTTYYVRAYSTNVNGVTTYGNEVTFTTSKKTLEIIADVDQNKIYGETDPTLTYTATGFENGDDASILSGSLTREPGEAVGTYAIGLGSLSAGANYTIDFTGADLTIGTKVLSVTADTSQGKVYGDADPEFTYTATGFENGDDASILSGSLTREPGEAVGTYVIQLGSLSAGVNYTIDFTGADFTIGTKVLSVTADPGQNKVYGEADPEFTYTASGFENGDDASILSGSLTREPGEAVGTYAIGLGSLSAGANYTIDFTGADFTIGTKVLSVTADPGQNKVYGDADPEFTYTATGFENGDDASILSGSLTREPGEAVGTYAIGLGSLSAGANYTIDFTGADFTIGTKVLSVTADPGQSKIYGDADPEFTYTATGFENGDDASILSGSLTREPGEAVGIYTIGLGSLSAGVNYTIDFTGTDFTIGTKVLSVTADTDQSKIYGETDPEFTYTASGFENGDDASILSGLLTRKPGEAVGIYSIGLGSLSAGANYTIDYTSADFAINAKVLMVTADPGQNKVYGDADPIFTYTATGFENGDDASILSGSLTREPGEAVGIYSIDLGSLSAGANYTIDFAGADFAINAKVLMVTADPGQNKVYGDADPIFTYTATGFENGDDASILSGSLTREVGEAVGIYTIGLGSLSAGVNYTIDYTGADFTIGTKVLSVTADTDQSKIYGETDPEFTYTATGFENEDDASILSGSLTREVGEAVGIYSIGLGSLSAGANYTIDYTGADFAINAKVLMVTADPGQSKIYGDADQIFTYTATGFENGDDASILNGSLTREPGEAVGIYSIDLGSLSAGANYTIDFTGADFAINAKVLMVTADPGQNRVYGDADPIFTYTATGFENGDDASILNGSLTREPGEAVGLYAIQQGMLNAGTDYTIDFSSADFEITPAIITGVAFEDVNEIYDGTAKSIEVSGLPDGASVNYANNEKTNAGTYEVTATVRQENYNDLVLTAELTIEKAAAVIAADAVQAFTYNNEVKNVVASLNHTETGLTYMPQQGYADAGTYVIEISSEETANYLSASREVTLVIENTEIDGVTLEGASYVYDGTSKSLKVSGLPDGAAVSYANNGQINAGSYTVTATIRLDNYDDKVLTAQLDIEKAEQEINFNEIEDRNQQTDEHFQLEAISSSGLPVIYSYTYETENPAATVGPRGLVRILGGGEVWITATQEGNRNYEAATPVVRTLTIVGGTARLNSVIINGTPYSNPGEEIYYLIDCGNAENEVHIELEQNEGSSIDQGDSFTMSTPGAGIYRETVTVTSEDGNTTKTYNITVEKNFNFEDIVIQKFNNVMLINNNPETNGGYKFVSYRWYKDGSVIGNEQYFSAGKNADDLLDAESSYYVVLETAEGEILKTCTSEIQLRSSFNISLAPNPVSSGGTMELLADFPKDELETMQLSIHNLNGTLIKHLKSNRKITSITLPYTLQMGVYVLKIRTENFNKSVKFIIK